MQHPERQLFAETVFEDVAFGPTNQELPEAEVRERCRAALDLVGLKGLDDASPFELSGGQQRLCAIAGILAMKPRIIVLDEPTAGLDPRGRAELRSILDAIRHEGVTTVEVTHSMDDATLANKVIVLDQSRIMLFGTPHEVFCAANAKKLEQSGLGIPAPLELALNLAETGTPLVGEPLTMNELVAVLTSDAEVS